MPESELRRREGSQFYLKTGYLGPFGGIMVDAPFGAQKEKQS
jgi:hypothetical protein